MTSGRDTYNTSLKAASVAKIATVIVNEGVRQETVNASGCNVGYRSGQGGTGEAAFQLAVKTANQAKRDADFVAEMTKQASVAVARDTVRSTDVGPL